MVKTLAILFLSGILLFVIDLVRREKLTFKYAMAWLFVCVFGILAVIFDQFLWKIAHFLGFQLVSNFIFVGLLSVFVLLTLLMTVFLCQENNRNDQMAQKIAMLAQEVEQLKQKVDKK